MWRLLGNRLLPTCPDVIQFHCRWMGKCVPALRDVCRRGFLNEKIQVVCRLRILDLESALFILGR